MRTVFFENLGLIPYSEAWSYQESLLQKTIAQKMEARTAGSTITPNNYLLFCEHSPVYTLGKSGSSNNLLLNEEMLKEQGVEFFKINRGGDITFHGPGQLVGYPIFDLDQFFTDIHKYLRYIEEAVIQTLAHYNIIAGRYEGYTGVWIDTDIPHKARKICAIGVRCSRWVTMHGFALNVNTNLSYFNGIVPCGITDKQVTSIEKEIGNKVDINDVSSILLEKLKDIFEFEWAREPRHVTQH